MVTIFYKIANLNDLFGQIICLVHGVFRITGQADDKYATLVIIFYSPSLTLLNSMKA